MQKWRVFVHFWSICFPVLNWCCWFVECFIEKWNGGMRDATCEHHKSLETILVWWFKGCLFLTFTLTGWWFQVLFIIIPIWWKNPIWQAYFSDGLVQPSTSLLGERLTAIWPAYSSIRQLPRLVHWFTSILMELLRALRWSLRRVVVMFVYWSDSYMARWFQIFLIFTWVNDPISRAYCSNGLKQPYFRFLFGFVFAQDFCRDSLEDFDQSSFGSSKNFEFKTHIGVYPISLNKGKSHKVWGTFFFGEGWVG